MKAGTYEFQAEPVVGMVVDRKGSHIGVKAIEFLSLIIDMEIKSLLQVAKGSFPQARLLLKGVESHIGQHGDVPGAVHFIGQVALCIGKCRVVSYNFV